MREREKDIGLQIGKQLRLLREQSGRSQAQLAFEAGISVRALRALESGRSSPNLATVTGVAGAVGISLDDLVDAARSNCPVADWTPAPPKGSATTLLTRQLADARIRAQIIEFPVANGSEPSVPHSAVFGYVLTGSIKVLLDGEETLLGDGDSFHAQAGALQFWRSESAGARLLVVEASNSNATGISGGQRPG